MNCVVCGKEFNLWARAIGDAKDGVCTSCEEEGVARLDGLRAVIERGVPDDATSAAKWLTEFDDLSQRYRVPSENSAPRRDWLVSSVTKWVARRERVLQDDIVWLNGFVKTHRLLEHDDVETARAARCAWMRWTLQEWEAGRPPTCDCDGMLLESGEICHWQEQAQLLEQRTRREYVGHSQGVSVRIARGLYYRVGAFRGKPIETEYYANRGHGLLHITNRRIAFTGGNQAVAIPLKKILSIAGFENGFQIFRTNAKKPTILTVNIPELTLDMLALATPAAND